MSTVQTQSDLSELENVSQSYQLPQVSSSYATGHTYRRNVYRTSQQRSSNITISSIRQIITNRSNGCPQEISVTNVDSFFEEGFIYGNMNNNRHSYMNTSINGVINSKKKWEGLIDELESSCISKKVEYSNRTQVMRTTFSVPAIGYYLYDKNENNDPLISEYERGIKNKYWLCWKGVYYDPDYLYRLEYGDDHSIRKIRKMIHRTVSLPIFDDKRIREISFHIKSHQHSKGNKKKQKKRSFVGINHSSHSSSDKGWRQTGKERYLELDLLSEVMVTHIGTAGRFPVTFSFPNRQNDSVGFIGDNEYSEFLSLNKRCRSLTVVDSTYPESYVTSYKLSYYESKLKQWIELSDRFSGNSNSVTEVVQDLRIPVHHGIRTSKIRIEPLDSVNAPCMRVSVYGLPSPRTRQQKRSHDCLDEDIVCYTIESTANEKIKECMHHSYAYENWQSYKPNIFNTERELREVCSEDLFSNDSLSSQGDHKHATVIHDDYGGKVSIDLKIAVVNARNTMALSLFVNHLFDDDIGGGEMEGDEDLAVSVSENQVDDGNFIGLGGTAEEGDDRDYVMI